MYPNIKKRLKLIYFVNKHKSKNISQFINTYINIIK